MDSYAVLSRRRFLALVPVVGVAGCTEGDDTPPALDGITITNNDLDTITLDITVAREGETVHESTAELNGLDIETEGSGAATTTESGEIHTVGGEYLGEPVEYAVTVESETNETVDYSTSDFVDDHGSGCSEFAVSIGFTPGGSAVSGLCL